MSLANQVSDWIRMQVEGAGLSGVVLGLSGGIDSAVVSGLCARAVGKENVLGIIMPAHSDPDDAEHAKLAAETWGIEHHTIDLSGIFDQFLEILPPGSKLAEANIKPRLRMITLYHHANTLNRMVVGTGNKSELMIGYYTKYGDGGVDLLPIAGLLKSQVREVAREIGVPDVIIDRPPSAGLWEGQTDENEMGLTYEELDRALTAMESGDTGSIDPDVLEKVQAMHKGSEHKRRLPPIFTPSEG